MNDILSEEEIGINRTKSVEVEQGETVNKSEKAKQLIVCYDVKVVVDLINGEIYAESRTC